MQVKVAILQCTYNYVMRGSHDTTPHPYRGNMVQLSYKITCMCGGLVCHTRVAFRLDMNIVTV